METDAHSQVAAHWAVTQIDEAATALAVLKLLNPNCAHFFINFDLVEPEALQLFNLLLKWSFWLAILLLVFRFLEGLALNQVWIVVRKALEVIGIKRRASGRQLWSKRIRLGCHFRVLHFAAIRLQANSVDV